MTEETNMSSEEQESQKTSNSTEDKTPASEPAKEPVVPLHEHTALRGRAQAAELESANLRGQLTQLQQNTTTSPVKSPMEIEIAKQAEEGITEEDMTITPALYRKQKVFEQQQAEQAATLDSTRVAQTAQLASTNLAKATHDDWESVVSAALKHMTKGEILDIESEKDNFGEVAYAKAKEVLERVKPVEKTAPEKESSESEAAEKKAAEKTPTQDEILSDLHIDPVTSAALKL